MGYDGVTRFLLHPQERVCVQLREAGFEVLRTKQRDPYAPTSKRRRHAATSSRDCPLGLACTRASSWKQERMGSAALAVSFDPFAKCREALGLHRCKVREPPLADLVQRLRVQRVVLRLAVARDVDQAALAQHPQMARYAGTRRAREVSGDIAGRKDLARAQQIENFATCRIGDRGERVSSLLNDRPQCLQVFDVPALLVPLQVVGSIRPSRSKPWWKISTSVAS